KLDDFNAFLEAESGRRGGSTYVVDGQGLLIANSSGAAALADGGGDLPRGERLPARASGDPVIAGTAAVLLPAPYVGGGQVQAVEIEGRRVFCRALPVAVAGGIIWNIVVALPENVLLGRLRREGERALLLASLAALAALAVGVVLLGRVAAQLRRGSEAADAIAAGARNTRLPEDSRVRETRQLAAAFNSMTDALVSATVDLEKTVDARTVELRGANELLGKALEDSKRAQVQLILAEKMAALGQLVAGIAHELNTPVAAIVAANEIVAQTLTEDLPGILAALESLGPAERSFVAEALAEIRHPGSISAGYEPAEERRRRAALEARFEAAGVADAPQAADDLAALGLADFGGRLAPALAGPSREPLLRALRGLAAAARSARLVGESAEKASRVVAALQTYVRGEAVTETAPVDIGRELARILALHRGKIRGGVELAAELAEAAPALGRRDELNLVWTNLLENALYAVGDRGRVEVGARVVGDRVEVSVANDGPEIPDSLKPRIFEPFFSTKPAGEGAGIGLNLSRKIVEAAGGSIGFESAPGRTRFWVRLPLAGEPPAGGSPGGARPQAPLSTT
ncbi:MAG: HAMP domain-containing protein, partial [Spirochaetaceae bacterium]|nr:HAMP domain-containing protein [Spirochaetaceae bacterium]